MTKETPRLKEPPKLKETPKLSVKRRIVEISNKLKVGKSGKNKFANYDYITPEDIMKALNPLLEEYNLISIFNMDKVGENLFMGKLIIEDCDTNERMRYRFLIPPTEVKGASAGQAMGATFTYCKRYSLMNVFNMAGDDDLDKVVGNKNVASKPAFTIAEVIKKIKACKKIEDLNTWSGWADVEKSLTDAQRNVIKRAIEEQTKKCG